MYILSYKHKILHKCAFGCVLSYLSRPDRHIFSDMAAKFKMTAIDHFKVTNSIHSCMHQITNYKIPNKSESLVSEGIAKSCSNSGYN